MIDVVWLALILTCALIAATGFLWCLKHDLPHLYFKARRLVAGLMTAIALASTMTYIFVSMWSCHDVDTYSALWYAIGCWYWKTSS